MKIQITLTVVVLLFGVPSLSLAQSGPVLAVKPGSAEIFQAIDKIEPMSQADLNAGDYVGAETTARKLISLDDPAANTILAPALAAQGKIDEALKAYAILEADNDTRPRDMMPYALLLVRHGQWQAALAAYNKALPYVGSMLIDGHNLLLADSDYTADSPRPADLETDIHIALGFTEADDYGVTGANPRDRSLAEYREALKVEPDSPLANLAYANGLEEDGKEADATAAYKDVAAKYSGDVKIEAQKELGTYQPPTQASPSTTK